MVIRTVFILSISTFMFACTFKWQNEMCNDYKPVCQALKKDNTARVIITIAETADKAAFVDELEKQGVAVHKVIEVTLQVIADVNYEQLQFVSRLGVVNAVQIDRFNALKMTSTQ